MTPSPPGQGAPDTGTGAGSCDVLVIGSGVAGLVTALDLLDAEPGLRITVLDKERPRAGADPEGGGSTPLAQGGLAAAVGTGDSPGLHARDTLRTGDGLSDPRAVAVVTQEGPARVADLIARGAVFDRRGGAGGPLALAREGGQSVARSVRAADATGAEIARALRAAATGRVDRVTARALDLLLDGPQGRVVGALVMEAGVDVPRPLVARATVLATGGCGGLYAATTNPEGATADGVALAWRAGAELADLEFVQFHPTGLAPRGPGYQRFLLTEALRGAGATLVDEHGRRFMPARHTDAELAPRYVVTKAILDQPGGAWLDATAIPTAQLREEFPTVLAGAARAGYDLATDRVPVEPCQHYMVGGVATDLRGRTTVPGLWAAGEVACAGIHGANRMAGNSLLQASVFGHRVAVDITGGLTRGAWPEPPADGGLPARPGPGPPPAGPDDAAGNDTGSVPEDVAGLHHELREAMSRGAGAVRSAEGLDAAAQDLVRIRDLLGPGPFVDRGRAQLDNALTVAGLVVRAARLREESRGVHWRDDHPGHRERWSGVHLRTAGGGPRPATP